MFLKRLLDSISEISFRRVFSDGANFGKIYKLTKKIEHLLNVFNSSIITLISIEIISLNYYTINTINYITKDF